MFLHRNCYIKYVLAIIHMLIMPYKKMEIISKHFWSDYLVLANQLAPKNSKLTFLSYSFLLVEETAKLSKWTRFL